MNFEEIMSELKKDFPLAKVFYSQDVNLIFFEFFHKDYSEMSANNLHEGYIVRFDSINKDGRVRLAIDLDLEDV